MIRESQWNEMEEAWRNLSNTGVQCVHFLKKGYPSAFTQREIVEGINYGGKAKNISAVLTRLKNKGLIECKKPYWRFANVGVSE